MTLSIKSIGGTINEVPKVSELKVVSYEADLITIEYKVEDIELTICRQYLSLNSGERIEITKAVGYESETNTFRYSIRDLRPSTSYSIEIIASDGHDEGTCTLQQSTREAYVYGVRIMENNSNPESCVTYIEHAVGVSPATPTSLGGWEDKYPFNKVRLVGFKSGRVTKEVNPVNKTHYLDGSTIPSDVDIMVEIPKFYWQTKKITNGFELRICKMKLDSSWDCPAHTVNGVEKDNIYIGAYKGYVENEKLRSKSGVYPQTERGIDYYRNWAHAVGKGYQASNWYTWKIEQILYLIAYKNLDSQKALGKGYTSGSAAKRTGGTNTKGLVYGTTSAGVQMCFLGIEDMWGNLWERLDGVKIYGSRVEIAKNNASLDSYGYTANVTLAKETGYISKVSSHKNALFLPTDISGSETTYYTDRCKNEAGGGVNDIWVGAGYNDSSCSGGVFGFQKYLAPRYTEKEIGCRLCYLG